MKPKMHLSLIVRDLSASVKFYQALFGLAPHKERPGYANFDVAEPPLKLALNEGQAEGKGSLDHLGVLVPSTADVLAAKDRMIEAGLTTFSEEEVVCCYAKQDKIWVTDPDGHAWEIYALLDDMAEVEFKGREMTMIPGFRQDACCSE